MTSREGAASADAGDAGSAAGGATLDAAVESSVPPGAAAEPSEPSVPSGAAAGSAARSPNAAFAAEDAASEAAAGLSDTMAGPAARSSDAAAFDKMFCSFSMRAIVTQLRASHPRPPEMDGVKLMGT